MAPLQPPSGHNFPSAVDGLTEYDRAHFKAYIFLLDCDAANGDWRYAIREAFSIDADEDLALARRVYDANLARAKWMTRIGYRYLLQDA